MCVQQHDKLPKILWIHYLVQLPTYEIGPTFRRDAPLTLRDSPKAKPYVGDNWGAVADVGINGLQVLWRTSLDLSGQMDRILSSVSPYGIVVAPCLAVVSMSSAVETVKRYSRVAAKHRNAAFVYEGGRKVLVISIYGARYGRNNEFWRTFHAELSAAGIEVFLVGDMVPVVGAGGMFSADAVQAFAPYPVEALYGAFDGLWMFDGRANEGWEAIKNELDANCEEFMGGIMPGYDRRSVPNGGFIDPLGVTRLVEGLDRASSSPILWNHINSWNDIDEDHAIWPSTRWSFTRADITKFFYGSLTPLRFLSSRPSPPAEAQLYVTVPTRFFTEAQAQVLVLNSGRSPVFVTVSFRGAPIVDIDSWLPKMVMPGSFAIFDYAAALPGTANFYQLEAALSFQPIIGRQKVISPPVVLGNIRTALRPSYYSVAARAASDKDLDVKRACDIQGTCHYYVHFPNKASVRFIELVRNDAVIQRWHMQEETIPEQIALTNHLGFGEVCTKQSDLEFVRAVLEGGKMLYSAPFLPLKGRMTANCVRIYDRVRHLEEWNE